MLPGSGFSAEKHQPTSKAVTSGQTSVTKFPGTGSSASKHQPASQNKTSRPTSTTKFPGQGSSAITHQPASQTKANRPTLAVDTSTDPSTHLQSTGKHESHRPHSDRSSATDCLLTPAPMLCTGQEEIASLASPQMPVANCLTDLPWICTLKKGSYLMIQIRL